VGRRDALRADAAGHLAEGGIAGAAGLRLEAFPGRLPPHRDALEVEGDAGRGTEAADEIGVGVRLRAETVVDVNDVEREAEVAGEGAEHVEESDGIGSARNGNQDSFAAQEHPGAANGVAGERYEALAVHGQPKACAGRREGSRCEAAPRCSS